MTATPRWGAWLIVFAALAGPAAAHGLPASPSTVADAVQVIGFDPVHTRFGFQLRTRWGHRIDGAFPHHDGALLVLPDGRRQVRIRLATAAVEVDGSEHYAEIARGERFFDAARYPVIEFLSEPHLAALAHTGGTLRGRLTMHGISRIETFAVAPATCARPGIDCDVVASGSVDRGDFGLDQWRLALTDTVSFDLRVRLQASPR